MCNRLIIGCFFVLICSYSAAEERKSETQEEVPKLESFPIKAPQKPECKDECETTYRLPAEQLDKLREIESYSPGTFIHMTPQTNTESRAKTGKF